MASGRKNYFRHHNSARHDEKIASLIEQHGKEAYFHYFVLIELCAEKASEEFPSDAMFHFHPRTLSNALLVKRHTLISHMLAVHQSGLCKVFVEYQQTGSKPSADDQQTISRYVADHQLVLSKPSADILKIIVHMPNLAKYMGRYETKIESNAPNKRKEKEIKEKESKENKKESKKKIESPLKILFEPDHEIQTWFSGGLLSVQERLLNEFDENYLRDVLVHCFEWQRENKKRSAGTFIEAWIKRDKNAKFKGGLTEHQKKLKDFFESQGIQGEEV